MGGNYKMQTLKNSIHYVAASKDEEILKNSSSGGIFSEIAYCIFKMNGVVFGALIQMNIRLFIQWYLVWKSYLK